MNSMRLSSEEESSESELEEDNDVGSTGKECKSPNLAKPG